MPVERRRSLWVEPLPAVELAHRLRVVPLFAFASVDELFRIAMLGRQIRHEAGRVLYEAGRPVESLQCLLDGRVSTARPDGIATEIEAPAVLGFEGVIEGSPARRNIRAVETCITLSLTTEEFLSLLSENVEIAQGIFRLLIDRRGRPGWHTILHGEIGPSLQRKIESGPLQPVDSILLLQSSPLLDRATAAQLVGLAGVARPITLKKGGDPLSGAEPSIVVVLSGAIRIEHEGGRAAETAGPGDVLGVYETLGGVTFPVRAEVETDGKGLRFLRSDVLDLLADDIGLLRGIFSALLRLPEQTPASNVQ